jgi:Fe-Mn family superoxide dismutase
MVPGTTAIPHSEEGTMAYTARDWSYLLGMPGFSDTLLNNHFSLYQGYVNHANKSLEILARLEKEGKTDTLEYHEIKRHFGWEFDGMRVHEYYFDNLGGSGDVAQAPELRRMLEAQYGSHEVWEKDFRATGAVRGIGWAILYQDNLTGRLLNFWINEHDKGHPAGCTPILVMDAWEHAYMIDYGIRRAGYINAFFRNIHWERAQSRVNLELARQYA